MRPDVHAFFDPATFTLSYVVADPQSKSCAIVDPVLDYDPRSGRTRTKSAEKIIEFANLNALKVEWILETHIHADHLSAAPLLQSRLGGRIAAGARVPIVQATFKALFNLGDDFTADGRQFDHLFADGEEFAIGTLTARAMFTPGHTPACVTYLIGDAALVGDTLFAPDLGTARCDVPGGDPATLFGSIRSILALPPQTRIYLCHDYPEGRKERWLTTVAEQRAQNIHIHDGIDQAAYVALRGARDKTLSMPVLILPAVQVNMRAGRVPAPETNGVRYLKIPLDAV